MSLAATIATILLAIVALFQMALALGAPWGTAAWGVGNYGVPPKRLRIASGFVALVVYPLIALYVLASAGSSDVPWIPTSSAGMWVLAGFFMLGGVANFVSPSKIERVWAPVSLVIAVCCAVIANMI